MKPFAYYYSPEFIYTVLCKPAPFRFLADQILMLISPRHLQTMGVTLALNPKDPVISGALTLGVYETTEIAWVKSVLRPGMSVLDLGANIGLYSAVMAKAVGSKGKVYAFEPDPANFGYLTETLSLNGLEQVVPYQKACGGKSGKATLFQAPTNKGDHRLYQDNTGRTGCEVEVVALDELYPTDVFDFIKVDIQGYELYAFKGMEGILHRNKDVVIFTEFWPEGLELAGTSARQLLSYVRNLDFEVYEFANGVSTLITDDDELIARYPGRKYGNLILQRAKEPALTVPEAT